MRSLNTRLANLETKVEANTPPYEWRWFYVEGNDPNVDVGDFLRECGHDLDEPGYRAFIHTFISAKDGKPVYEPYRDVTAEMRAKIR